jgi:hypothetical protein
MFYNNKYYTTFYIKITIFNLQYIYGEITFSVTTLSD